MIPIGCNCGKKVPVNTMGWTVDLAGQATFPDGKGKAVFATIGEANIAIARLGLSGKIRPRAAVVGDAS